MAKVIPPPPATTRPAPAPTTASAAALPPPNANPSEADAPAAYTAHRGSPTAGSGGALAASAPPRAPPPPPPAGEPPVLPLDLQVTDSPQPPNPETVTPKSHLQEAHNCVSTKIPSMDPDAQGAPSPWPNLPADALSEITGRLHDAGDFVRIRAVCRPWHEALTPSRAPSFLPWIVEAYDSSFDNPRVLLRSPFSTGKNRHLLRLATIRGMSIQGSHASSGRVLGVCYPSQGRTAVLINPLDGGDATLLPPVPQSKSRGDKWQSASGAVVSSNGAVVFHTLQDQHFAAIQLPPGELAGWEEVAVPCPVLWERRWQDEDERRAAVLWSSVLLRAGAAAIATAAPELPPRPGPLFRGESNRYLLEFRGELLCVDIVLRKSSVSVRVHTMRAGDDGWRRRDCADGHLCFFLGPRSSFAVDAQEFAGSAEGAGGSAYFFDWRRSGISVCRYNFQSGSATVLNKMDTYVIPVWFMPRPRMSPLPPRAQ